MQWTNIPPPAQSLNGHFCLLARFVADSSTPDPIAGEIMGNGVWGNVYNSNNIAWKNVTVVDNLQNLTVDGLGDAQFIVRNIFPAASSIRLSFDFDRESETFFKDYGEIQFDLGEKLFSRWKERGMMNRGVKVIGPTTIALQKPHTYIDTLTLSPREEHVVTIHFRRRPHRPSQRQFTFHVTQSDARGAKSTSNVIGGVTFVIRDREAKPRR